MVHRASPWLSHSGTFLSGRRPIAVIRLPV
jgi:hypothetical protein